MKRIKISPSIPYGEVKIMAGNLMMQNPKISSVKVVVEKETLTKWIEYTEFSEKVLDKISKT